MADDLSGITIVIFIAIGVLVLVVLFIFGKRQIMRFSLRSRRGPHVPVGHDAPRWMRKEIERRLDLVARIKYEPYLLQEGCSETYNNPETYCRVQALDSVKHLETQLQASDPKAVRQPCESLRAFLISLMASLLKGCNATSINHFCDLYEKARYSPDNFNSAHLQEFQKLSNNFVQLSRVNKYDQESISPKLATKYKKKKEKATTSL